MLLGGNIEDFVCSFINKGLGRNQFRTESNLSSSTYTKLVNDECTTTDTLLKIANYLECNVSDIVEFIKL